MINIISKIMGTVNNNNNARWDYEAVPDGLKVTIAVEFTIDSDMIAQVIEDVEQERRPSSKNTISASMLIASLPHKAQVDLETISRLIKPNA
jgi:hypothetical protein